MRRKDNIAECNLGRLLGLINICDVGTFVP